MSGWTSLIHRQRRRRIGCETARLNARLAELRELDPGHYYNGDWNEAYNGLLFWAGRDPFDESHWTVVA